MESADLERELEQHHVAAFGWALACSAWNRGDAEDALQSSYLKVLDGRACFDGRSSFRTWLFGVIRRTAAEQRRRRAIHRFLPLPTLNGRRESVADAPDGSVSLERSETTRELEGALASLSPRQREVLHLVFYQDFTIEGAAAVLGLSVGAARTHYERGKSRLRQKLQGGTR